MSEKNTIVFQSEGTFNPGILLTKSNCDIWSQLVEMHIVEREKLSYSCLGSVFENLPKDQHSTFETSGPYFAIVVSGCPLLIVRHPDGCGFYYFMCSVQVSF